MMRSLIFIGVVAAATASAQVPRNPVAGNPQAVEDGRSLYNGRCTTCHGPDGTAGERAPGLGASGRRYLRTSDQDLFDAIQKGIPSTAMPASGLPDNDVWKLVAYVRSLRGTAIDAPALGDAARGEQVYLGKGGCSQCHMLKGKGGLLGPDLSAVANRRKLYSIRDALTKDDHRVGSDGGRHEISLEPSFSYQGVKVTTRDGKTFSGVLKNEDSFSLQMMGTDNELHLFTRDELREVVYSKKSLMPSDYDKRLTPEELQDLLAFLTRLGTPARR